MDLSGWILNYVKSRYLNESFVCLSNTYNYYVHSFILLKKQRCLRELNHFMMNCRSTCYITIIQVNIMIVYISKSYDE